MPPGGGGCAATLSHAGFGTRADFRTVTPELSATVGDVAPAAASDARRSRSWSRRELAADEKRAADECLAVERVALMVLFFCYLVGDKNQTSRQEDETNSSV